METENGEICEKSDVWGEGRGSQMVKNFIGGTQNLVLHRNKQSSTARLRRDAVSVLCHK